MDLRSERLGMKLGKPVGLCFLLSHQMRIGSFLGLLWRSRRCSSLPSISQMRWFGKRIPFSGIPLKNYSSQSPILLNIFPQNTDPSMKGLPVSTICMCCKSIQGKPGDWHALECALPNLSHETRFSHGICPVCYEKHIEA